MAALVFAAAAIVAVVQATGSADAPAAPAQAAAAQSQTAEPPASSEPSAPGGSPAVSVESQPDGADEPEPALAAQAAESDDSDESETVPAQQSASQDQQPQSEQASQTPQASAQPQVESDDAENPLSGFIVPIRGACITEFEGHLPSATRAYRNDGVHEGLDFYQWASCTVVDYGTEILAAKAGVVIRADVDYIEITPADWQRFEAEAWQGPEILDELRGRQVWIDHGRGIITRYAHLSAIAAGIVQGAEVQQGQLLGYPGESGQQEVYANPGTDIHLHFEIRVGSGWLGQGQTPQEARQRYLQAFGLAN